MSVNLEQWPAWAEEALQGLAFWIGHRHALYRHYPLSEGALVAETCNLIHNHLKGDELLLCEQPYRRLVPRGMEAKGLGAKSRADLVVIAGITPQEAKAASSLTPYLQAVIEVKRASAPKAQIDYDLQRLAMLKRLAPGTRALLFLVSEARRPKRFVLPEGRAIPGETEIPSCDAKYRVRRACKASAAFSGKDTAHYACIVEVYSGQAP